MAMRLLKRLLTAHSLKIGAISLPLLLSIALSAQTVHYLDCGAPQKSADSLSPETAWNAIEQANEHTFQPGDQLLLKRGTACHGMLSPRGSGDSERPILIGAYGVGALPIIFGDHHEATLKLVDQDHWEISRLELVGGSPYGLLITGSVSNLTHFRLTDLVVHDVSGTPKQKQTGLIVITPQSSASTLFHDIVIDGVTAYNTSQWAGIFVSAGIFTADSKPLRGSDVVVRNSVVHDVAGDGILLMLVKNGKLEWNVAWDTGLQYTETIGTPNSIWEWMCEECVVQFNEGFFSDSPGVDGGVFDIDYGNIKNTVQYNFGHDSQGYCVSAFGVDGGSSDSVDSIIRGNLCIENGRSPREAERQGAMFFSTVGGGRLRGIEVYGNTVFWDPPVDTAAIVSDAMVDPLAPHAFRNNLVISRSKNLTRVTGGLQFLENQYVPFSTLSPNWQFNDTRYPDLSEVQAVGQENGSSSSGETVDELFHPPDSHCQRGDPLLDHDIFGDEMKACAGAVNYESRLPKEESNEVTEYKGVGLDFSSNGWSLIARLTPEGFPGADDARREMTVLKSMEKQFAPLGLHVYVVSITAINELQVANWANDWNFGEIQLLNSSSIPNTDQPSSKRDSIRVALVDREGKVTKVWRGLTTFPAIELALRQTIGTPVGMQTINDTPKL
jgi:hypothetical protein